MASFDPETELWPTEERVAAELSNIISKRRQEYVKGAPRKKAHEGSELREAGRRLFQHMIDISDDPTGSDPAEYLHPQDAETCRQFVDWAKANHWPGARDLSMRSAWMKGWTDSVLGHRVALPAWRSSPHSVKAPWTKRLFFPVVSEWQGYSFGKLRMASGQVVALCDDGLLRSERGPELTRSKGIGWGRLPDKDVLLAAVHAYTPIGYGNEPLSEILLAQIPPELLPTLSDPEHRTT